MQQQDSQGTTAHQAPTAPRIPQPPMKGSGQSHKLTPHHVLRAAAHLLPQRDQSLEKLQSTSRNHWVHHLRETPQLYHQLNIGFYCQISRHFILGC